MTNNTVNSVKNVDKVVTNKTAPVNTQMDVNMSDAYIDIKNADDNANKVAKELNTRAEKISSKSTPAPTVKTKNMYTKLTLDEGVRDFNISFKDLSDESDEDEYLDYDMFHFVYGLVTDDWPKPKNPLGRRMRKFQHTDSDDYIKTNEPTGMSQVTTDPNGNVVVYANTRDAFNDVREACDYYHINYSNVHPRMNKDSHWAFNMTVYVPMTSDGYPVMVEDFFAKYGWKLSDVIEDHKVGGGKSANWGATYDKRVEKDIAEKSTFLNDKAVNEIFEKFVEKAAINGDIPLETFIKEMFSALNAKNLTYSKISLKKRFLAEFDDGFEDD